MVRLRESFGPRLRSRAASRHSKGKTSTKSLLMLVCIFIPCSILLKPRASLGDILDLISSANSSTSRRHAPRNQVQSIQRLRSTNAENYTTDLENSSAEMSWYSSKPRSVQKGLIPTWTRVLARFMANTSILMYATSLIEREYNANLNNVQDNCVLVKIRAGQAAFVTTFPAKTHTRFASVVYVIQTILKEPSHEIQDVTFLVMLSDGHKPHVPTFGSARHWKSWTKLIPIPMGNARGYLEGSGTMLAGWDAYVEKTITSKHELYPWKSKIGRAIFRGTLAMQSYTLGSCNAENGNKCVRATRWDQVNRGVMYRRSRRRRDLFDIRFTKHGTKPDGSKQQMIGAPLFEEKLRFQDFQLYKYVLCVGSNQDWAERLRNLLFMNSAVVLHKAETEEFFYPLLVPWKHIIPVNLMMTDLLANVKWAVNHDDVVQRMIVDMNQFARLYLSEHSMTVYWKLALNEFAARQRLADKSDTSFERHHGRNFPEHDRPSHSASFGSAAKDRKEGKLARQERSGTANESENNTKNIKRGNAHDRDTTTLRRNVQQGASELSVQRSSSASTVVHGRHSGHAVNIKLAESRSLARARHI